MVILYFIGCFLLIAFLSSTTAPDAFIISIAILLAGLGISSAIRDKTKK